MKRSDQNGFQRIIFLSQVDNNFFNSTRTCKTLRSCLLPATAPVETSLVIFAENEIVSDSLIEI